MDTVHSEKLRAAKEILEKKEALEEQIYRENLKINDYEVRLQGMNMSTDTERLNRKDKGRIKGKTFLILGAVMVIIGIIPFILAVNGIIVEEFKAFVFLSVYGIPPLIVGACLYGAYKEAKEQRELEARSAKRRYDAFLNNEAGPAMEESKKNIAELNLQLDKLMQEHAETLAFLPQDCRNAEAVAQMLENIESGSADSVEKAIEQCDSEEINQVRQEKMEVLENKSNLSERLKNKLQEIRRVLVKKEEIETLIFEENLKVHAHKITLQMMESKMSTKMFNRKDRGLRLGRRFGIVAILILIISCFCGSDGLIVFALLGIAPSIACAFLLSAYARGKREHERAAIKLKVEYREYLENRAKPEMVECGERIAEMMAQCKDIEKNNAEILAFLPKEHCNVECVNHMIRTIGLGSAGDLKEAILLCEKEKVHHRYQDKLNRRKKELAVNYVDPDTISTGSTTGWMILDGILDSIFGR